MDKVINLGIPHIREQIFENIDTDELLQYLKVSHTWKILAERVLLKRWKNRIFEACFSGKTRIVQLVLEHSANTGNTKDLRIELNAIEQNGGTAFMAACYNGHKDVVQLLLNLPDKTIELNARTNNGTTAFMAACHNAHKDVVQLLLNYPDKTIDLNARKDDGTTAFMLACNNGHTDIVQLFLLYTEKIIELNTRDQYGGTALMWACINGH